MNNNLIKRSDASSLGKKLRRKGLKVVFTNGVFDILHRGHVDYLAAAKKCGDVLIVGLNSDASVRRLKGAKRPIQKQADRAAILLALSAVDYVIVFGTDTPEKLITEIRPDVLVKGADYKLNEIVGSEFVQANGGEVRRVKLTRGRSSTQLIKRLS